jgi:hypothetical protein
MIRKPAIHLLAVLAILVGCLMSVVSQQTVAVAALPNQPSNVLPYNGAEVQLPVRLESSAFSDPDAEDTHASSQWQVTATAGDYTSPVFDRQVDAGKWVILTGIWVPEVDLDYYTTYYWRVRHQDNHGDWSDWSVETSFSTGAVPPGQNPPNQPSNTSPSNGATDISLTPTLAASAFFDYDAGDTHASSQWQVTTTAGDYTSPVFDSLTDTANLTSMAVPSGILTYSTTYYWHVRHQDNRGYWSAYSAETSFTIMPTPSTISSVSRAEGTQGKTLSVTITGTRFTDATAVDFGSGITVNTFNVKSSTRITASITIASDAVLGLRDVSVTIPGGATGTLTGGFTVVQARPTATGVTPSQGARGQTLDVTITGTSFTGATAVSLGPGITVKGYTVVSLTQITANISIDPTAKLGNRNVSVATPAGAGTLRSGFVVLA